MRTKNELKFSQKKCEMRSKKSQKKSQKRPQKSQKIDPK